MQYLFQDQYPIIIQKKSIKRLYLRVKVDANHNPYLLVTAPRRTTYQQILHFVQQHTGWVRAQIAKIPPPCAPRQGGIVYLFGAPYFAQSGSSIPAIQLQNNVIQFNGLYKNTDNQLFVFYKQQINRVLPVIGQKYTALLGVQPIKITIRKMKTRWGSCNPATEHISINSELARFPVVCLDYVLLHEYCHVLYPNHSDKFWQLVEQYMPNRKQVQKILKQEQFTNWVQK